MDLPQFHTMHIVPYTGPDSGNPPSAAQGIVAVGTAVTQIVPTVRDLYNEYRRVYGYTPATVSLVPSPGPIVRRTDSFPNFGPTIAPRSYRTNPSSAPYPSNNGSYRRISTVRKKMGYRRSYRKKYTRSARVGLRPKAFVARPLLRAEVKQNSTNVFITTVQNSSGLIYQLDSISQGTGAQNRLGTAVKRLGTTIELLYQRDSPSSFAYYRFIVFRWNQGQVTPGVTSILEAAQINANYNQTDTTAYKILKDVKWENVAAAGTGGSFNNYEGLKKFFIPESRLVAYRGAAATDGDNQLWMIFFSNQTIAANLASVKQATRFIDV